MAVSFDIEFIQNTSFNFTDNTDYTGLTVDETNLHITYPQIDDNTEIVLDVFNENVAALGDNFSFVVANESQLDTLISGVYRFEFRLLNLGVLVSSSIKYVINDYDIFTCLNSNIDLIIDKQCDPKWCELGAASAMLDVAKIHAANGDYNKAEEIMTYLLMSCNEC